MPTATSDFICHGLNESLGMKKMNGETHREGGCVGRGLGGETQKSVLLIIEKRDREAHRGTKKYTGTEICTD